jgi:hypothetical protein
MNDLLTIEEDKQAAAQGWGVHHVYDLDTKQWGIRILPAEAATQVVNMARAGQALSLKAIRLMTNYKGKT